LGADGELFVQGAELRGGPFLFLAQVCEPYFACLTSHFGLCGVFAGLAPILVELAQAVFFATCLGQRRFGCLTFQFGLFQGLAGGTAGLFESVESLLHLGMLALMAVQGFVDFGQKRRQLPFAHEAMTLRCQAFEQPENTTGIGKTLLLGFGLGELLPGAVMLAL